MQYSTTCINSTFEGYSDLDDFIQREFDVTGVRRKGYRVSAFRSDGFQVHLSFIALGTNKPVPTNTDRLKDAGYVFPKPPRKVVGTLAQPGVFTVGEKRVDVAKVPVGERSSVRTTVIDPGCVDVVSVRTTSLSSSSPSDILSNSSCWALSSADYTIDSGTLIQRGRESKRRSRPGYRDALRDNDKGRCLLRQQRYSWHKNKMNHALSLQEWQVHTQHVILLLPVKKIKSAKRNVRKKRRTRNISIKVIKLIRK